MSEAKKKPGGLLDQYNLLGAIIDTSWATRLDHKVARHIIDRYYPKHGNGRASLRYLERATGALRPNIIASLRRLSNSGAITMVRQGQGTRPTEYALNFEFPASGIAGDTSSTDEPSGIVGDTSSGIVGNTSSAASGIAGDTESYLRIRPTKAEIRIDRIDPAAPLAPPPADGLAATAAGGTAVEGLLPTFEVLWRTYGFARGKKVARRAWSALPIEVDRAAVIRAASEWQASWAAQGKPDAPRKHLATWLKDECYDENAPKGFVRVEKPGKIQPKPRQLAAPTTTHITGTLRAPPPIIAKKIVAAGVEREDGERLLSIEFEEGGSHSITLEANDSSTQAEGQREFGLLLDSVGLSDVDDPAQLVGRTVHVQGGQFVPKPDDDDDDTIIDQAA